MDFSGLDRIAGLLWPSDPVQRAREEQLEEDMQALKTLEPEQELAELQTWLDLDTLRQGARRETGPLEWVRGCYEIDDGPPEQERTEAATRLAERWVREWKLRDPEVRKAARLIAGHERKSQSQVKEDALKATVFEALQAAREPQLTKISLDRAMALGSKIVLRQEQDLEQMLNGELTQELIEKLGAPPVGIRALSPFRLVGGIEAALLGYDPRDVRPTDLRPAAFRRWVRRRAIALAEELLLDAAELDGVCIGRDRRMEIAQPDEEDRVFLAADQVRELDVLEVLEREEPDPPASITGRKRLGEVLEAATPKQREIIGLLRVYHVEQGLPRHDAVKAIAEVRGVGVNAIHQVFSRLRRRLKD